jgi:hypothetical protein
MTTNGLTDAPAVVVEEAVVTGTETEIEGAGITSTERYVDDLIRRLSTSAFLLTCQGKWNFARTHYTFQRNNVTL